jgi:predicted  nucleic acid-binding Zn-ribbon protein
MQMQEIPPQIQQVMKVFAEYERAFKAADLITSGKEGVHNANLLVNYLMEYFGGVITVPNIIAAEKTLGAKLFRVKPKTVAEIAQEQAEKAEARMRRDYLDSIRQQPSFEERVKSVEKAEQESKGEEKRQQAAQSQINILIDSYSINLGPGRLDFSRAEYFQDQLRKIKVKKNGKYDAVLTLRKVQEALTKLP